MKKFEKVFFNLLTKNAGFYMKDYYSEFHKETKWIGILDMGNVVVGVIISKDSEEDINYEEGNKYLSEAFNKPHLLNLVVLASEDYINFDGDYNIKNKVVFSLKERRVIYCSEASKSLVPILEYIVKVDTTPKREFGKYKLTYSIIIINVLIYIISAIKARNLFDIDVRTLIQMGAKVNILIDNGQVWRLITSAFLHGGLIHVFFNMLSLKIIGTQVEEIYGIKKYISIYFISIIGSSLLSYILGPNSVSVGASGAIFGLLGAMLTFAFKERKNIGKDYMMNIIQVIVINIIIGVTIPNIDNYAHLGGLIYGSIYSLILYKTIKDKIYN
ncbi:rhomboid family intramembrane serine protease [Clostridium carnis]